MKRASRPAVVSPDEVPLDRLLGRRVVAADNQSAGRIEEFRAEKRGADYVVTEYVIGGAGLLERLGVGVKLLLGRHIGGRIASWNQLDITDPDHPRLICPLDRLRRL